MLRTFVLLVGVTGSSQGLCQTLYYQEPGNASCALRSASTVVDRKQVKTGMPVTGSISISCGFGNGSYTVTLGSTDPGATFAPKSFLVNFGSLVGDGQFTVTFATMGRQTISAIITSNMGSPAVPGRFTGLHNEFDVERP
jgi:hypothetical protein